MIIQSLNTKTNYLVLKGVKLLEESDKAFKVEHPDLNKTPFVPKSLSKLEKQEDGSCNIFVADWFFEKVAKDGETYIKYISKRNNEAEKKRIEDKRKTAIKTKEVDNKDEHIKEYHYGCGCIENVYLGPVESKIGRVWWNKCSDHYKKN